MRARMLLLLLAIVLVAGFAAQNWPQFMEPRPLTFGVVQATAPLGALLLGLLALGLVIFLISSGLLRSRMMVTEHRYTRDLQAQRELADKAEASRFTELRQYLDSHFREHRQRDAVVSTEFEKSVIQSQRELRSQLDQMNQMLGSRLSELEGRLEARMDRMRPATVDMSHRPVEVPAPPRDHVKA